jgi:hypothetical protein
MNSKTMRTRSGQMMPVPRLVAARRMPAMPRNGSCTVMGSQRFGAYHRLAGA